MYSSITLYLGVYSEGEILEVLDYPSSCLSILLVSPFKRSPYLSVELFVCLPVCMCYCIFTRSDPLVKLLLDLKPPEAMSNIGLIFTGIIAKLVQCSYTCL
ncbi:hypothetical protein XENTR_v10005137 [Xenopus tropicalis]|nr:hypothetical protein XENTR_v10005137 [Xenopus tropicalis]